MSQFAALLKSNREAASRANSANRSGAISRNSKISRGSVAESPLESRRKAVVDMLNHATPETRFCWCTDDSEADFIVLALAIRDVGTCELSIPREKYDGFKLLEIIGRADATR